MANKYKEKCRHVVIHLHCLLWSYVPKVLISPAIKHTFSFTPLVKSHVGQGEMQSACLTVTLSRANREIRYHVFNCIYTILILHNSAICPFVIPVLSCGVSQKELRILMQKPHLRELFSILLLWNGKWLWRSKYKRKTLINTTLLQLLNVLDFLSICNLWISKKFQILFKPFNMLADIVIQVYT